MSGNALVCDGYISAYQVPDNLVNDQMTDLIILSSIRHVLVRRMRNEESLLSECTLTPPRAAIKQLYL